MNWSLFKKTTKNPEGKRNIALGDKVSTNVLDTIENSIFKPSPSILMAQNRHPPQDISYTGRLGILKSSHQKSPPQQHRWLTRLAAKELHTRQVMTKRGSWPTPSCHKNCGHPCEEVTHIFQCHKVDETWENLKKVFLRWGEQKNMPPT